jgi:SAM-dependent methyltransferase
MNDRPWFESFFGEDYFETSERIPSDRTAAEVDGTIALLALPPGARLLDVACGHGRHSIELSKRGYDVTGYDLSQVFLDRARADAEAHRATVRWVHGDMRDLPFDGEFDAAINIFTAFGYFENPEDDMKALGRIRASLRPGGRFLLETVHRDALPVRFQPRGFERTSSGSIVLHERRWDLARDVIDETVTLIRPDGTRTVYTISVRMRSLDELILLMQSAGLEPEKWYGGLDGRPLDLNSPRLVLVSRK